eukprot:TRINITY_DN124002_c0_g1_i1.p1 TRINITY_DN124002_c0_g1~~TRINITY_DN124002_c0_g1_i1.p1  ORF type:complete len:639 (-),score=127.86 TRINITY_DN124002_c0_g1_i1:311-2227(-)
MPVFPWRSRTYAVKSKAKRSAWTAWSADKKTRGTRRLLPLFLSLIRRTTTAAVEPQRDFDADSAEDSEEEREGVRPAAPSQPRFRARPQPAKRLCDHCGEERRAMHRSGVDGVDSNRSGSKWLCADCWSMDAEAGMRAAASQHDSSCSASLPASGGKAPPPPPTTAPPLRSVKPDGPLRSIPEDHAPPTHLPPCPPSTRAPQVLQNRRRYSLRTSAAAVGRSSAEALRPPMAPPPQPDCAEPATLKAGSSGMPPAMSSMLRPPPSSFLKPPPRVPAARSRSASPSQEIGGSRSPSTSPRPAAAALGAQRSPSKPASTASPRPAADAASPRQPSWLTAPQFRAPVLEHKNGMAQPSTQAPLPAAQRPRSTSPRPLIERPESYRSASPRPTQAEKAEQPRQESAARQPSKPTAAPQQQRPQPTSRPHSSPRPETRQPTQQTPQTQSTPAAKPTTSQREEPKKPNQPEAKTAEQKPTPQPPADPSPVPPASPCPSMDGHGARRPSGQRPCPEMPLSPTRGGPRGAGRRGSYGPRPRSSPAAGKPVRTTPVGSATNVGRAFRVLEGKDKDGAEGAPMSKTESMQLVDELNKLRAVAPNQDRKAFMKSKMLLWHPDKNLGNELRAKRMFQLLQEKKTWFLAED